MPRHTLTHGEFDKAAKAGAVPTDAMLRKNFVCDDIKRVAAKDGDATDISRRRTFVISTGAVDRDNDIVEVAGWDLDNFKKNPVVLFGHDYKSLPIAKAVEIGVDGGKLVATAEFADHEFASTVLRLIDGGFLRATSVGFNPKKYTINEERRGLDFTEVELLEFSVVPVPANPEALMIAREFKADVEAMRTWAKSMLEALDADVVAAAEAAKALPVVDVPVVAVAQATDLTPVLDAIKGLPALLAAAVKDAMAPVKADEPAVEPEDPAEPEDEASKAGEQPCCAGCGQKSGNQCAYAGCGHFMCGEHTTGSEAGHQLCSCCAAKSVDDAVVELIEDDDMVLELSEPESPTMTRDDMKAALAEAVKAAVGEMVRAETAATLNRLKGRVD